MSAMPAPIYKEINLHAISDDTDTVIRASMVHGKDIIKLIGQTGLPTHTIQDILDSKAYEERMKVVRKDPKEVIPALCELYARMSDEARNAASSRDRQAALKLLIEIKQQEVSVAEMDEYR